MELTDFCFWFGFSLLLLKNERNYRYLCAEDNDLVKRRKKVMVQVRSEGCWSGGGHGHGVLAELRPKKGQSTLQPPGVGAERMGPGQARM